MMFNQSMLLWLLPFFGVLLFPVLDRTGRLHSGWNPHPGQEPALDEKPGGDDQNQDPQITHFVLL